MYQLNTYCGSATVTNFITFTYSITTLWITKYLKQMIYIITSYSHKTIGLLNWAATSKNQARQGHVLYTQVRYLSILTHPTPYTSNGTLYFKH